jgi:hypothetical protein
MNKIIIGLFFGLITSVASANDWIVNYNDAGRPETITFDENNWFKLNEENGLEYWINMSDIQEYENLRHVMAMINFTGEPKVVPGVGRNIKKIYSEGILHCGTGYLLPITDFYTTATDSVVGWHEHKNAANDIVNTKEIGTIGNAIYSVACLNKIPSPVPNR